MRIPNSLAIPYAVATLLSLGAGFMPWIGHDGFVAPVMNGTVVANAWNSHLVGGRSLLIPNWTPLLILAALTLWAWGGAPRSRLVVPAVLYGLAHTLFVGFDFYRTGRDAFPNAFAAPSHGGIVGGGTVLTFIAYAIVASATATYLREQRSHSSLAGSG